jgi:hypothetical protein
MSSDENDGTESIKRENPLARMGDLNMPRKGTRIKIYIILFLAGAIFILSSSSFVLTILRGIKSLVDIPISIVTLLLTVITVLALLEAIRKY